MVDPVKMEALLVLHEGLRLTPYFDSEGNLTVGVGYNVTARGWVDWDAVNGTTEMPCTRAQALAVLASDIVSYQAAVLEHFPPYASLSELRQRVVLDCAFNMGFRALGFKNCIAAIERQDWSTAARELYNSKAYQEEPNRIKRLATMLLTNAEPTDVPPVPSA